MKRVLLVLFAFFVLSVSTVLGAPTLEFQHEATQQGETIFGVLSTPGEFLDEVSTSDVTFYEGRKEVFFEFGLQQFEGVYYLYVYATKVGNFTIEISSILYNEEGELGGITLEKNFTVTEPLVITEENETYTSVLFIRPGVVFTGGDAVVDLINKGTSSLGVTSFENESVLEPGQTKTVVFTPQGSFSFFDVSSYKSFSVPVIYFGGTNQNNASSSNNTNSNETFEPSPDLRSDLANLSLNLIIGNETPKHIRLFNFEEAEVSDLEVSSDVPFLVFESTETIAPGGSANVSLIFSSLEPGQFDGTIIVSYVQFDQEAEISIPIELFVFPAGSSKEDFTPKDKTCRELSGRLCETNEICDGSPQFATDGWCCVGICRSQDFDSEGSSSRTWATGLLILIFVGMGGYYLYMRYQKTRPKNPREKLSEASKAYDKRVSGGLQRN